jgi:hypothetical protein
VTYGGHSGNRIFVLYWRCSLIRVSVIRGSVVYRSVDIFHDPVAYDGFFDDGGSRFFRNVGTLIHRSFELLRGVILEDGTYR